MLEKKAWNVLFRNNIGGPSKGSQKWEAIMSGIAAKYPDKVIFDEEKLEFSREQ